MSMSTEMLVVVGMSTRYPRDPAGMNMSNEIFFCLWQTQI